MNKICVVMLILGLLLVGTSCGRSNEKSEVESKIVEEVKSLEKKASGEVKKLEKDVKLLREGEKDYEKALEEEPKPPADAMEGVEGALLGEEFDSPPE